MPVISRKFINKRFLKKYKQIWIRKVKPWWSFYKNRRRILWLFKRQYRIRWNRKWFLGLQSRRFLSLRSNIQLLRWSRGGDQMKIFSIRRDFLVLDNFLFNLRHSLAFRNGSGKYLFFLRKRLRAVKRRTSWKRFVRSKNKDNKIRVKTRVFFNLFRSRRRQFSTGFSRFELFLGVLFMLLKKHWNYFIKQFYIWAYLRNYDYTWHIIKKADRRLAFRTRTNIIHFSSKKLYVPFFLRRKVSFVWSKTRNRFYKPLFSRVYFQKKLLYDRRIATARLKHTFSFVFFSKTT